MPTKSVIVYYIVGFGGIQDVHEKLELQILDSIFMMKLYKKIAGKYSRLAKK